MVFDKHPPGPLNDTGEIAYIMNMSTDPEYRRMGVTREILNKIIEFIRKKGVKLITVHTTEVAKPLYSKFGFVDSNEMKLSL